MGVYGEIIYPLSDLKFRFRVRLKRWNDGGEFELDRAKSKNNIAENSIALGHDTHNTCILHEMGLNVKPYLLLDLVLF